MHLYGKIRAGLWHRHCRQLPRAYDVEEAYTKDGCKNILNYVSQQMTSLQSVQKKKKKQQEMTHYLFK